MEEGNKSDGTGLVGKPTRRERREKETKSKKLDLGASICSPPERGELARSFKLER